MKKIHNFICPDHEHHPQIVQLSLDGILESKSSSVSLDTYSLKFSNCRNIYPVTIIRPCERYKYDELKSLEKVLSDINENDIIIECCVMDKPKRSMAKCSKCASAKYPCEYCQNHAVPLVVNSNKKTAALIKSNYEIREEIISEEIQNLMQTQDSESEEVANLKEQLASVKREKEAELKKTGRKQLTWPSSTMAAGNERTLENIQIIVNNIEDNPDILKTDPDSCKGIKGKSPFLDQPHFNYIDDIVCEYMHLVCLGVVKRCIELTFRVGDTRERKTKRKLSNPQQYNDLIKLVQVAREFSHRCRILDFGVMKASDFRNIILFFFPILLECIDDEYKEEKKMWLHLTYMIRACVIPNNEYCKVNPNDVSQACKKFYKLYEKLFGPVNCTYSIHMVGAHLLKIRGNMPLTHRSAFKFENFFSEMRNMFQPGTVSSIKQILQNCYMKRLLEHHKCEKSTFFKPEKQPKPGVKFNPPKENNHSIYVTNENETLSMYSIHEIIDEDRFLCKIQGKFKFKSNLTPEYNWSAVGVYKVGPISDETKIIHRNEISGKVLKVNGYLITCPNNVLHEQ